MSERIAREAKLRGRCFRAWMFVCCDCLFRQTYSGGDAEEPRVKFRQSNAAEWAKAQGWRKRENRWVCDACVERRNAARKRGGKKE